jgi:hypothetical protein
VRTAFILLGSALALAALGCNEDPGEENGKGDHQPAPLPKPATTVPYPSGPYGFTKGSTIEGFTFQGFVNARKSTAALEKISLTDFYNPHAHDSSYQPADAASDDRLFPPGSPYGEGTKKPLVLLIDIASVWCGPCNVEAKSLLNGLYDKYKPCGGEFLFQLAEGAAPGSPVDEKILKTWVTSYKVGYPATIDSSRQLFPLYSSDSFPDGAIIDTSTMKIVDVILGTPDDAFWSAYESLLEPGCLAGK